nr:putative ergothioneine biosynthesis protein 1 [Pleurotus citrinopileatus]
MTAQIVDAQMLNHAREQDLQSDLSQQLLEGLYRPVGRKEMPTVLLYDERGLRLYDDITTKVSEYYLFGAEEEILKTKADEIIQAMHPDEGVPEFETVLELGAGSLRKTSHILAGLSRLVPSSCENAPITYYALDLEHRELQRCLDSISESKVGKMLQGKVDTKGLCGTYEDGLKFIEASASEPGYSPVASRDLSPDSKSSLSSSSVSPSSSSGRPRSLSSASEDSASIAPSSPTSSPSGSGSPLHILFLGSSLGNFSRSESVKFLQALPLRPGSGDTLLIGLDHDNDKTLIEEAYNDRAGYTKRFIMNGLRAAGRALGDEKMFDEDKWEYVNQYNEAERRHEAYYKSKCSQTCKNSQSSSEYEFLEDELVKIEVSYKFSNRDAHSLFIDSGLRPIQRWTDSATQYSLWLVERPPFMFPLLKSPITLESTPISTTPFGIPSLQEWTTLWASWDFITLKMIPPSLLFVKPIHLRHICLFYLGHIPTFLDIHLSRLLDEPHTEPENFKYIFERGIDPNVDNPEECHPHSEVPQKDEDWPSLQSILQFQSRVRERVLALYDDISCGRKPLTRSIGRVLFMTFEHEAFHLETLLYMLFQAAGNGTIPPQGFTRPPWKSLAANWSAAPKIQDTTVVLGPETITLGHDDSEDQDDDPAYAHDAKDHEFGWDNERPKRQVHVGQFKIEWRPVTNGQFLEFYQTHKDRDGIQYPASWVEKDGETMVRTLYGPVPMKVAQEWPIVTSYDNMSAYAIVKGGRLPTEPELRLFLDKFESGYEGGANAGFRNWHPVPATTGGEKNGGKGHNGGVWEWTSTVLEKHDGFVPSKRYPGFTGDFFDGCHNIILGGSYANIPRMTERRTMRNWYQRNYPFAWTGGRIAYDI